MTRENEFRKRFSFGFRILKNIWVHVINKTEETKHMLYGTQQTLAKQSLQHEHATNLPLKKAT